MKTVWKYILELDDNKIKIPSNMILCCESQDNNIVVYAVVDTENLTDRNYEFVVVDTGEEIDFDLQNYNFLNTVKIADGVVMKHIFYKRF